MLHHISRCARIWILVLLLPAALPCVAQKDRLPDTVSTSDEELPPMKADEKTDSVAVSSSTTQNTDNSSTTQADTAEVPPSFRMLPQSWVSGLKRDPEFEYANDPEYWLKEPVQDKPETKTEYTPSSGFSIGRGVEIAIYCLLGLVLLAVLGYIIAENNLRMFYRKPTRTAQTGSGEPDEPEEGNLDAWLKKSMQSGEYRPAVRFLYLKALRLMEEKEVIRYQMKATGQDYLRQMSGHPLAKDFGWLQSAYERVWYGEFPIDEQLFGRLHQNFLNFYKSAGQFS